MTRTIDFDTFRAEKKREAIELTIGGKTYSLPPALPVAVAIDIIRLKAGNGDEVEVLPSELDGLGAGIFGSAVWESLKLEHSLGVDETSDLFKLVLGMYAGTPADPQKASTPETPESSSL